jgi:hypothetical protein
MILAAIFILAVLKNVVDFGATVIGRRRKTPAGKVDQGGSRDCYAESECSGTKITLF